LTFDSIEVVLQISEIDCSLRLKSPSQNPLHQFLVDMTRCIKSTIIPAALAAFVFNWNAKRMQCRVRSLSQAILCTSVFADYVTYAATSYSVLKVLDVSTEKSREAFGRYSNSKTGFQQISEKKSKKLICTPKGTPGVYDAKEKFIRFSAVRSSARSESPDVLYIGSLQSSQNYDCFRIKYRLSDCCELSAIDTFQQPRARPLIRPARLFSASAYYSFRVISSR